MKVLAVDLRHLCDRLEGHITSGKEHVPTSVIGL